jgi:hypothetical protein
LRRAKFIGPKPTRLLKRRIFLETNLQNHLRQSEAVHRAKHDCNMQPKPRRKSTSTQVDAENNGFDAYESNMIFLFYYDIIIIS